MQDIFKIRNFAIIAHIDAGKSTLADRFLEITKTIPIEKLQPQYLDRLSLERERGITIKMQPVRMLYHSDRGLTQTGTQTGADNDLLYKDLTYLVRGIIFKVKNNLGLGHKENIYQQALGKEFDKQKIKFEREKTIDVVYEGEKIGIYRPDFVIENKILIELKSQPFIGEQEKRQLWTYLRGSQYLLGLLVNFGRNDVEIQRIVYDTARLNSLRRSAFSPRESAQVEYELNLIDTPGHIDFSYEVSRALAAVEGVILLIDGTQGIQAQTLAHLEIAKHLGLTIIPAINKIDLNPQNLDLLVDDISKIVEIEKTDDIFLVSAKTGEGVEKLLEAVIQKIPCPKCFPNNKRIKSNNKRISNINNSSFENNSSQFVKDSEENYTSALIFDSHFDSYKGIIAHTRIFDGELETFQNLYLKSNNYKFKPVEVGIFSPDIKKTEFLKDGEIGYIATGIKDPGIVKIGDTIVFDSKTPALAGYKEPQPVIFASVFPSEEIDFKYFKESIDKLRLNDPSIFIDLSYSPIFGRGYLIGCMGLLHLDIFQERLKREFGTEIIITLPSLKYEIIFNKGQRESASSQRESAYIQNAQELPPRDKILEIKEPWTNTEIFTPFVYIETIFNLIKNNRGVIRTQSVKGNFAVIEADIPLDELITGFFDDLKSISSGYASLTWEFLEYRAGDLVKLDILIAEETNAALSKIIIKNRVEIIARKILKELKELLPREQFPVKLQAAIEGKIIARETIPALKADVTGYLYGGDRTRKMKLWQKQKRGKKKLTKLGIGRVRVPNDVLIKILKVR